MFKFVVRASCPRLMSREQDAPILPALYIKGARCSHYRIFWKNWDAPRYAPPKLHSNPIKAKIPHQ